MSNQWFLRRKRGRLRVAGRAHPRTPFGRSRTLRLEPLEERSLLEASAAGFSESERFDAPTDAEYPLAEMFADDSDLVRRTATTAGEILVKFREGWNALPAAKRSGGEFTQRMGPHRARESYSGLVSLYQVGSVERIFPDSADAKSSSGASASRLADVVVPVLGEATAGLARWHRLQVPAETDLEQVCAAFAALPEVEYAEPNYVWTLTDEIPPVIENLPDATTDPDYDEQWFHENAWTWKAWDHLNHNGVYPGGAHDVVVAVIDSGVDYTHEDLAANMWVNPGEIPGNGIDDDGNGYIDDVHGVSVVSNPNMHTGDPIDYHGHGTHVAGIIAAQGFNGKGGVGVAFNTRIMAIRAAQYSGVLTIDDIAEGILYAVDHGADVINMSFGGYTRSQIVEDALEIALNQAVLVAAAGNDSLSIWSAPLYPAALPYVLGVEASTSSNKRASFSNYGYEIMAPGASIHSTLPGNQYAKWSGTSMATPVVSGVAALMRSYFWQRDIYSSRFLMGGIAASGGVVDAYTALIKLPAPGVRLHNTWLFDSPSIDPANDGDGRADAGETIHIGFELINRSGQADHVIAILDAYAAGASQPDPYVEILSNTVIMRGMGPFSLDDNGLIYDEGGVITGVEAPWVVEIDPNCPNDHVINFVVTIYFEDGWNAEPEVVMYERLDTFQFIVQRGRNLPPVISEDMTLTAEDFWIVGGPVLVEPGATLRIEDGTMVQWGAISSDPYNPGPQSGYIIVRGTLDVQGTYERPVVFLPSYLVSGQTVDVRVESGGRGDLSYVKVRNPSMTGFNTIDHGYFDWDRAYSKVSAKRISNSLFHKFRSAGDDSQNYIRADFSYDTVLFDAGWWGPKAYGPYGADLRNSVVLQDNENNKPLTYPAAMSYQLDWLPDPNARPYHVVHHDGHTYALLQGYKGGLPSHVSMELTANFFGGHLAIAETQEKDRFLVAYWESRPIIRSWEWAAFGLKPDGYGYYEWIDGTPLAYTNWRPQWPDPNYRNIRESLTLWGEDSKAWGNRTHVYDWGVDTYILELPGQLSEDQLIAAFASGQVEAYVSERLRGSGIYNAFLSSYWNPSVTSWMRVTAPSASVPACVNLRDNYWGTSNTTLIDHAITDYYDNFTTARVDYGTPPDFGYESTYPFVEEVFVNGVNAITVPTVGAGPTTFTVTFNRDMDTTFQPFVGFGPSPPHTDFQVHPVGGNDAGYNRNEIPFTVSLSQPASEPLRVAYRTVDGTALAGVDYTATSGVLTFEPGVMQAVINVPLLGNTQEEPDKSFFVRLSNATIGDLAVDEALGTILDDNPVLSVADTSVIEGDDVAAAAVFTVTLSKPSDHVVTVHYFTEDATAFAGVDYFASSGMLVFEPGSVEQTISVPIIGDTLPESDETFRLRLTHATVADLDRRIATATIIDDDSRSVTIEDVSVVEGDTGTVDAVFRVRLSGPALKPVTVSYTTADGTAKAGSDYEAVSGTLAFVPGGPSEQTIVVPVFGDTEVEVNEEFYVRLTSVNGALVSRGEAIGTIIGDDGLLLSISDVVVTEGTLAVGDPEPRVWSSYLGGTGAETIFDTAVDAEGNVWVVGSTTSNNFPATSGLDTTFGGNTDGFAAKFAPDGQLLWATYLGANNVDVCRAIALDSTGNAWITGDSNSTVAWFSGGRVTPFGGYDAFLVKLGPNGRVLSGTYSGGTAEDRGYGVAIDGSGTPIVVGGTVSTDWIQNGFDLSKGGTWDGFVAKYDSGGQLLWSSYLGGSSNDEARAVTVQHDGRIVVAGWTESSNWLWRGLNTAYPGSRTGFVAAIRSNGELAEWATYVGGDASETIWDVAIDPWDDVWVVGETQSEGWIAGSFDTSYGGETDGFVAKLSSDGQQMLWSTYLGANRTDRAYALDIDASGAAWVVGKTESPDWVTGGVDIGFQGASDAFLAKLDTDGQLLWSSYLGGDLGEEGRGVAVDADGNAWVVGQTESPGWVSGGYDLTLGGTTDAFLARIGDKPAGERAVLTVSLSETPAKPVMVEFTMANGTAQETFDYRPHGGLLAFGELPGVYSISTDFSASENAVWNTWSYRHKTDLVRNGQYELNAASAEPQPGLNTWYASGTAQPSVARNDTGADYVSGTLSWPAGTVMLHPATDSLSVLSWRSPIDTTVDVSYRFADLDLGGSGGVQWFVEVNNSVYTLASGTLAEGGESGAEPITIAGVRVAAGDRINFVVAPNGSSTNDATLVEATIQHEAVDLGLQRQIVVPLVADRRFEPDETFEVRLLNANVAIAKDVGVATLLNDDPRLSIGDAFGVEGDEGVSEIVLEVGISEAPSETVTVHYETMDGTAAGGQDFVSSSGTLTFPAGQSLPQFITIAILPDTVDEPDEHFFVRLFDAQGAEIHQGVAQATIVDDDDPSLSVEDAWAMEGDEGTAELEFVISLSEPPAETVTVQYATADGPAEAGSDYLPMSGSLVFEPDGLLTQTVVVTVLGDRLDEPDETVYLVLTGAVHAEIARAEGLGTIRDDEPTITIDDVQVVEGHSGTVSVLVTVRLSAEPQFPVTVDFATRDGAAAAGEDYSAVSGTLTFLPGGGAEQAIEILVHGDTLAEPNETFLVELSNASAAAIADPQAVVTIIGDDGPLLSIADVEIIEGHSGTTYAQFTVSLSDAIAQEVRVDYATADGTAKAGEDYQYVAGTLIFPAGPASEQTLLVPVLGDRLHEGDETFFVDLTNATLAGISRSRGVGTILCDDPVLSIDDVSLEEGNSGNPRMEFTVTVSQPLFAPVTVDYATAPGTAKAGNDYLSTSGTLTFEPGGPLHQQISVYLIGDTLNEIHETFTVQLNNATGAAAEPFIKAQGVGTITDDDGPKLMIEDASLVEGDSGQADMLFTVRLTEPAAQFISVDFATGDMTARAGLDYLATSGSLEFPIGETEQVIAIPIPGDLVDESDEQFRVVLSGSPGVPLLRAQAVGTISDDDTALISIGDATAAEGFNGWVNSRTWQGTFWITPMTGESYHLMRISGAVAADDPWLVSGYDVGRFRFQVKTMGVAAMTLQATGQEGSIGLTWAQDDFDLLAGYHLYRSTSADGTYQRINSTIIPVGQESFVDTNVTPAVPMYYKFTVVATDMTESDFSNVAAAGALDSIPPVITHVPKTSATAGAGLRLTAAVTDNVGVESVVVNHRARGSTGAYTTLAMNNVSGNDWSATIPGAAVQPPGVEYYVTASDGISTVYHGTPAAPHTVVVDNTPTITSVSPNQGDVDGGTLVTIGGTLFQPGAAVYFGGLPAANVNVLTANQIACTTPPHYPATVDVTVVNPDETTVTLLRGFRFVDNDIVLSMPNRTADHGAIVEIPVSVSNADGLLSASVEVSFNPAVISLQSAAVGALTFGWSLETHSPAAGRVRLAMAGSTSVSGTGDLARLTFQVVGAPTSQSNLIIESAEINGNTFTGDLSDGSLTVNGLFSVSGRVTYYTGGGAVGGTQLNMVGVGQHQGLSDTAGDYTISDLQTGAYTLTPAKTGDVSEISALDASWILQKVVGSRTLSVNQTTAADVDRSGNITSYDATLVLQQSVGLITVPFPGAGRVWDFVPEQRTYPLINSDQTGQNFTAILLGDVTGNWQPPAGAGGAGIFALDSPTAVGLRVSTVEGQNGMQVHVPILVEAGGPAFQAADLVIHYDAAVLEFQAGQAAVGSAGSDMALQINSNNPGVLRIGMAGSLLAVREGTLLELPFDVLAPLAVPSPLSFESARLDEGQVDVTTYHGGVQDTTPPSAGTFSPTDDAIDVALDTNLVITFSEEIRKAAGAVFIKRTDDDSTVESIDVGGAQVSVAGAVATIDLSAVLLEDTSYYVEIAPGAFEDLAGNSFPGVSGATAWNFTTLDMPSTVVGRHIFYNRSYFDGNDPAAGPADDGAIAPSPGDLGEAGTHRGADNELVLSDPTQSWTPGTWVGMQVANLTDGSTGIVSANTATTVTASLAGGMENDWDAGDEYLLVGLGKTALLPGRTATFANYTSYCRGINGIMVDIDDLSDIPILGDFDFRVGNDDNPAAWPAAPDPQSITVRWGEGVGRSDRVTIIWADDDWTTPTVEPGAIAKQWLQVTVKVTDHTGLAEPDVFYWGNAIGESGLGNTTAFAFVTVTDELAARNNPHNFLNRAGVEDFVDYNRDSFVTITDELIARNNGTNFLNALKIIAVPPSGAGASGDSERTIASGTQLDGALLATPVFAERRTSDQVVAVRAKPTSEGVWAAHDVLFDDASEWQAAPVEDESTETAVKWLRSVDLVSALASNPGKGNSPVDEIFAVDWIDEQWPNEEWR